MRQLVYTMFISSNRTSFHLWWRKIFIKHPKVSKFYETDWSRSGGRSSYKTSFLRLSFLSSCVTSITDAYLKWNNLQLRIGWFSGFIYVKSIRGYIPCWMVCFVLVSFLNIYCPSLYFSLDRCSLLDLWIFTWAIPPPLIENTFEDNLHRAKNTSVLQCWIQANSASQDLLYLVFLLLDI